jgi:hypothetical protein
METAAEPVVRKAARSAFGCSDCGRLSCICEAKPDAVGEKREVCSACRRARCICKSRVDRHQVAFDHLGEPIVNSPQDAENLAVHYFYERDAVALARLVRSLAEDAKKVTKRPASSKD